MRGNLHILDLLPLWYSTSTSTYTTLKHVYSLHYVLKTLVLEMVLKLFK